MIHPLSLRHWSSWLPQLLHLSMICGGIANVDSIMFVPAQTRPRNPRSQRKRGRERAGFAFSGSNPATLRRLHTRPPLLSHCDIAFDWTAWRTRAVVVLLKKETTSMSTRTLQTRSRRRRRAAQFLYVISFAPTRRRRPPRDEGPTGPRRPRPVWHVRPLAAPAPRPALEPTQQSVPRILVGEDA